MRVDVKISAAEQIGPLVLLLEELLGIYIALEAEADALEGGGGGAAAVNGGGLPATLACHGERMLTLLIELPLRHVSRREGPSAPPSLPHCGLSASAKPAAAAPGGRALAATIGNMLSGAAEGMSPCDPMQVARSPPDAVGTHSSPSPILPSPSPSSSPALSPSSSPLPSPCPSTSQTITRMALPLTLL